MRGAEGIVVGLAEQLDRRLWKGRGRRRRCRCRAAGGADTTLAEAVARPPATRLNHWTHRLPDITRFTLFGYPPDLCVEAIANLRAVIGRSTPLSVPPHKVETSLGEHRRGAQTCPQTGFSTR